MYTNPPPQTEVQILRDALDHISRVASKSRTKTRRLRWIEQRALNALDGIPHTDGSIDLPKSYDNVIRHLQKKLQNSLEKEHG